jgi:hypothetical protein
MIVPSVFKKSQGRAARGHSLARKKIPASKVKSTLALIGFIKSGLRRAHRLYENALTFCSASV